METEDYKPIQYKDTYLKKKRFKKGIPGFTKSRSNTQQL